MKKLTLLSVLMFAASSMFAQTSNPVKNISKGSNQTDPTKNLKTAEVKAAGANNPVGKVNTPKPAGAEKAKNTKAGALTKPASTKQN